MSRYEEGLSLIEERCGNGQDNVITLATIAMEPNENGMPRPYVRDVDAYYENGTFYVVTSLHSNKMLQIEKNHEVAFSVCTKWLSGNAIGKNLGWVLAPENATLRLRLREVFHMWYDFANDESNKDCIILAIVINRCTIVKDHGADVYHMDFENMIETREGIIK